MDSESLELAALWHQGQSWAGWIFCLFTHVLSAYFIGSRRYEWSSHATEGCDRFPIIGFIREYALESACCKALCKFFSSFTDTLPSMLLKGGRKGSFSQKVFDPSDRLPEPVTNSPLVHIPLLCACVSFSKGAICFAFPSHTSNELSASGAFANAWSISTW